MSVRVRYKFEVAVSSTSAEERDLGNKKHEIVSDGLGEGGTWKTKVPGATTDLEVTLRDVSDAKLLAISTNSVDQNQDPVALDLKLNAIGADPITIQPLSGTKKGNLLLTTTGLTALYLTNSGSVDMEVIITVAGD